MARYPFRRAVTALLTVAALGVLGTGAADAQVPPLPSEVPTFPTEEPTDEPVPEPTEEPSPSEEPQPSPSESQPTSSPSPEPSPDVADGSESPGDEPSDEPSGGQGSLPGFDVFTPEAGQPEPAPGQEPQVAPGRDGSVGAPTGATGGGTIQVRNAGVAPLAAALPGTYGIGLLAALLGVATLFGTFTLTQRGLLLATHANGGTDVETTRRWRTTAGIVLLAAAALVGIVGYIKISIETQVPVQVVYMASAGFGVIVLAAAGGAMLISEQLRADEDRLNEIESALATIAGHLAPAVSEPARLLDRSEAAEDDDVTDEVPVVKRTAAEKSTATKRPAAKKTSTRKTTAKKPAQKKSAQKDSATKK